MTETEARPPPHKNFFDHLITLRKRDTGPDRAAMARLRRSLGVEGMDYSALMVVGAHLPADLLDRDLDTYLLVAGLFALHPDPGGAGSLGKALQQLRKALSVGAESLDRRFAALLDSDWEDLPYRLRQIVQLLESKKVPVNYTILLGHLKTKAWESEDRWVQRRWAREYWTGASN